MASESPDAEELEALAVDTVTEHSAPVDSRMGKLTPFLIDLFVDTAKMETLFPHLGLPVGLLRETSKQRERADGTRALAIRILASEALQADSRVGVYYTFAPMVRFDEVVRTLMRQPSMTVVARLERKLLKKERRGRPRGAGQVVHTRVWAVECLRHLCGLKAPRSLEVWNEWFAEHTLKPDSLDDTGVRTYQRDAARVVSELPKPTG